MKVIQSKMGELEDHFKSLLSLTKKRQVVLDDSLSFYQLIQVWKNFFIILLRLHFYATFRSLRKKDGGMMRSLPSALPATVNRRSYIMFSLCCPLYGLELVPGKHCPVEEMVKTIAGSITTTMSVCSGDPGFLKEMGRDVTKEERGPPTESLEE